MDFGILTLGGQLLMGSTILPLVLLTGRKYQGTSFRHHRSELRLIGGPPSLGQKARHGSTPWLSTPYCTAPVLLVKEDTQQYNRVCEEGSGESHVDHVVKNDSTSNKQDLATGILDVRQLASIQPLEKSKNPEDVV